jgi:hypothetical protein
MTVVDFEDARAVGWRIKPWWWGGWGTYHVAPWGMADAGGWLLAVGAHEWLWGRELRYRPEPGTPLYFVTLGGEPDFQRPSPAVRWRISRMAPTGDWPWWWQPRLDSDPPRWGMIGP